MTTSPFIAFPAGILISTAVSSMGIGGGILWMPFFLIVLKLKPEMAILTSLLIQTAGMGSGTVAFIRQKNVDYKLGIFLLLLAVPGITAGAFLGKTLKPEHIQLILGLLVMTTAFLFVSTNEKYDDLGEARIEIKKVYRYSWIAVIVSVGSGMLSTGIGEWLIPVLRSRLSLRMRTAIATCVFVTFGICVIGACVHFFMGKTANFEVVLWGVTGVIIGGQIGPRINQRFNERLLKEIFIFLLTLVGIHLVYNSY